MRVETASYGDACDRLSLRQGGGADGATVGCNEGYLNLNFGRYSTAQSNSERLLTEHKV